jgi:ACGX-repeat protein
MNTLEMLDSWKGDSVFSAKRSAQSYFGANQTVMASSGSACGAGNDNKPNPKPTACGSACGAGDDGKPNPKPSACGAGDK